MSLAYCKNSLHFDSFNQLNFEHDYICLLIHHVLAILEKNLALQQLGARVLILL